MFTGIIQAKGRVHSATRSGPVCRLQIERGAFAADARLGDSICINGVCLTVAVLNGSVVGFDVVPETLSRSNLGRLQSGDPVNAERSLRVGDRLDGHFVQGHVDGRARVERIDRQSEEHRVWLSTESELMRYVVPKGSVTLDGVSLTVADLESDRFSVALIPTTLHETTLGDWRPGHEANLETDILVRSVAHLLRSEDSGQRRPITMDMLREHGFAEAASGGRVGP